MLLYFIINGELDVWSVKNMTDIDLYYLIYSGVIMLFIIAFMIISTNWWGMKKSKLKRKLYNAQTVCNILDHLLTESEAELKAAIVREKKLHALVRMHEFQLKLKWDHGKNN